jgi:hypothetical protein
MGWKALKSWVFLAAFVALGGPGASATGDLSCTIDDANLAFTLHANTSSAHGTIVNLHNSSLTLRSSALAMAGRKFKVEPDHIIQQWFQQRELRIAVNIDNGKESLLLAIMGEVDGTQGRYSGRYVFELSLPGGSTWTTTGSIKGCSAG